MVPSPPYMDVRTAPLNPCSIETIPIPIQLANGQSVWPMLMSCYELTNHHQATAVTTPTPSSSLLSHAATNSITTNATVISSLSSTETSSLTTNPSQTLPTPPPPPQASSISSNNKSTSESILPKQHRMGHMDVSFIAVPQNIAHTSLPMPLQFDTNPITLPQPSKFSGSGRCGGGGGGILDGQWSCLPSYILKNDTSDNGPLTAAVCLNYCFASAHSTGEIQLHALHVIHPDEYIASHDTTTGSLVDIQFLGHSNNNHHTNTNTKNAIGSTAPNPLCLSLRWDTPAPCIKNTSDLHSTAIATTTPTQIVSTYSNGTMAIHDVVTVSSNSDNNHTSTSTSGSTNKRMKNVQLIERDRWDAHTMFPTITPAEVWTAAFVGTTGNISNVVWSGGDDMKLKIWDTRSTIRPMISYHSLFEAGVTCISPHPIHDNIVAVGSYDENVILFDKRYINAKKPFWKSGNLGGGIWRMKWHPYTSNRMLVGAMHGGCCVLNFYGTSLDVPKSNDTPAYDDIDNYNEHWTMKCTKYFTEHESMVYGADWLVCPHPTQNGYFEAAASCSFYDRKVYLWDSVF